MSRFSALYNPAPPYRTIHINLFTYRKWTDAEVEKYSPLRRQVLNYAMAIFSPA